MLEYYELKTNKLVSNDYVLKAKKMSYKNIFYM